MLQKCSKTVALRPASAKKPWPTVARMETLAKGDMSVSVLLRLLEAAGYDLKVIKAGHQRTVEDILAEQRSEGF